MSDPSELTLPEETPPEETPPEETPPEESSRSRRWPRLLLRVGAGLGTGVAALAVVGWIWGDRLVTELLLPRISDSLDEAIDRPTKLGDVTGFSFWGVKLGETIVPPTSTDASSITVDQIEVKIGLRSLLFQQTLKANVVLVRPEVLLVQDENGTWTDFDLPEADTAESRIETEIQSITIRDAEVTAIPYANPDAPAIVARNVVQMEAVDIAIELFGENAKEITFKAAGTLDDGTFALNGEGDLNVPVVKVTAQFEALTVAAANLFLPDEFGASAGELDGNVTGAIAFQEDGSLDQDAIDVRGTVRLRDGEAIAVGLPAPITDINTQLLFQGQKVVVEDTALRLNDISLVAFGEVDWEEGYDITAQIPAITVAEVQALAAVDLPVAVEGAFGLNAKLTGALASPALQGQLSNLQPLRVDRLSLESVVADFELTRDLLNVEQLQVYPTAGGQVIAGGVVDLSDLETLAFELSAQADVPADSFAQVYGVELPQDIVLGQLTADVAATGTLGEAGEQIASADWQLAGGTFPGTGEIALVENTVMLENVLLRPFEGTLAAAAVLDLEDGDWQAVANAEGVPVGQFTTQLDGLLSADVEAAGNLDALSLEAIAASGTAVIADAALTVTSQPLIERGDWRTAFVWEGDQIAVQSFDAPGVRANGTIGMDFDSASTAAEPLPIGQLNLNVALDSFDLGPLNSFAPPSVTEYAQLAGATSFDGQLFGTLDNPQIAGTARVDGLAVNELLFQPLSGPVAFSLAAGGRVNLQGPTDRLAVTLRDTPGGELPYWPASFAVRNDQFIATGYSQGNNSLYAELEQLPLETLGIRPAPQYGFGTLSGLLTASVDVNLADFSNPAAVGSLRVSDPSLDPVEGERFTTRFAYANSTATLSGGELLFDESRYLIAGSANLAEPTDYEGALTVADGRIEDLIPIVQALDLGGLNLQDTAATGSAIDLATVSVGVPPNESLLEKLQSFVEFVAEHPELAGDETGAAGVAVPELEELEGMFTGVIEVAGRSLAPADITADFDIRGNSWEWGDYTAPNEFALVGEIEQQQVEIETAFVNAGETQIELTGNGNFDRLTGELMVENLPVALAQLVYPLPVDLAGDLDLAATFGGSLGNPTVRGTAMVAETRLNGYDVERVATGFAYSDALLRLDSEVGLVAEQTPVTLVGTVPYALPFMTVAPVTNLLDITVAAPNESLEVVNALTGDRLRWQSGEGNVEVQVGGTLADPAVVGEMTFRDAVLSSPLLEDDLTALTGRVLFNLERLDVQQLTGQMGDGRLAVNGRLPLLASGGSVLRALNGGPKQADSVEQSGLVVSLEALPVDYSDVLQAVFDGQVLVTGAVLEPTVSGAVEIRDGRIRATGLLAQAESFEFPSEEPVEAVSPYRVQYLGYDPLDLRPPREVTPEIFDRVAVNGLRLNFGDRISIVGQPVFNISAVGDLLVNGTLSDLRPEGTIELRSGVVNLFSTQFKLDGGAANTATFTPGGGINPYVDVVLTARVQDAEVTPIPAAGGFLNAEVNESPVETTGSVEYVEVRAVAQGLASELEDNLVLTSSPGRAQGELLALLGSNVFTGITSASYLQVAEFLGAGTLTGFGDSIADAIGLRSFSVFPTTDTGDESVGIGIGVEATAAIGDRVQINLFEVLNSSNPPQLGVEYRLTDDFTVRGDSNLDQTDFELEYQLRF